MTTTTLQTLAQDLSSAFEERERTNGDKFRALKDGSPSWMTEACYAAHGEMMPDDWRYQLIERCADALAENDDEDDARDSLEPDIYTHELTSWVGSRADRYGYVDEAMEEQGADKWPGLITALQAGQQAETEEVFGLLVQALEAELSSRGDDEPTE